MRQTSIEPYVLQHATRALVLALLFCLLAATAASASTSIVPGGIEQTLHSELLAEQRPILIALPDDYSTTAQRYPVLYVLDGEVQFGHAAAAARFIASQDLGPPMIVVGVPNTSRNRDLTPPGDDQPMDARHRFVGFLETELVPHVERTYRAASLRVLFTHSRGGLIGLQALMSRPELFRAHIAASPYLSWNKGEMVRRVARLNLPETTPHFLFIMSGDGESETAAAAIEIVRALRSESRKRFVGVHHHLAGESHDSTPYLTLYRGLRELFEGWYPAGAVAAGDLEGLFGHYAALSDRFGYPAVPGAVALDETARALLKRGKNEDAVRAFERYVATYPADHFAHEGLSAAFEASGRREDALTALERALQIVRTGTDAEEREFLENRRRTLRSAAPSEPAVNPAGTKKSPGPVMNR